MVIPALKHYADRNWLIHLLDNINMLPSKGRIPEHRLKYSPRGDERHAYNLECTSERSYRQGNQKKGYATRCAADEYWKSQYDSEQAREGRSYTHQQAELMRENLKRINENDPTFF